MLIYYGRQFDSASVGTRIISVLCDKCGCDYFYELARFGSGSTSAPYAIGSDRAARGAVEKAQRELDQRLDNEAELVPCPKCHWINEGLVAGYRRSCYRGWAKFAGWLGFCGTFASLIGAWVVWIGPPADRGALLYFLVLGPVVSIAIAMLVLLGRNWCRSWIRPNRDYPLAPKLPHGSPASLIKNAATGQLEVASPRPLHESAAGDWIDIQVGRHKLPSHCCECLLPAAPQFAYRRPLFASIELVVPRCAFCASQQRRRKWRIGAMTFGATVLGLSVLNVLKLDEILFWILAIGLCCLAPCVGMAVADPLTRPVRVKIIDRSRGIARLWFRNHEYRNRVALNDGVHA